MRKDKLLCVGVMMMNDEEYKYRLKEVPAFKALQEELPNGRVMLMGINEFSALSYDCIRVAIGHM